MSHARLSASSAHRWMLCAGSVKLSAPLPNTSSVHAAQGTLAHDIAARCLTAGVGPQACLGHEAERDGHKVVCDQEMVDGVQFYLDTIKEDRKRGDKTFVEVDLTPALAKIDPDLGGTADHVRWRQKTLHLLVTDFKYGAGKVVEPVGNDQLMLYALGVLIELGKPAKEVTVCVVQPRIEHEDGRVRYWTFPAFDLLNFAASAEECASRTREDNAPLVPGAVQCGFCPARRICPALEKEQHALVAQEFSEVVPYDIQALSRALTSIPLVEARIKAIREFAYAEAERGNPPPGWKLVAKRGTRKWIDEETVAEQLKRDGVDVDALLYEPRVFRSPPQVEKVLGKKAFAEIEKDHVVKVSSGHTLAPESDKRPAVHKALTAEFAVIP